MASHSLTPAWAEFGRRLRAGRRRAGLTQAQLGRHVGYHHSLISKLESGRREPSADLLRRLDEVLQTGGVLAQLSTTSAEFQAPHRGGLTRADPTALAMVLFTLPPGVDGVELPSLDLIQQWPTSLSVAGVLCPVHPEVDCVVPPAADALSLLSTLRVRRETSLPVHPDPDLVHSLAGLLAAFTLASTLDPSAALAATVERVLHLVMRWARSVHVTGVSAVCQLQLAAGYAQLAGRLRMLRGQHVLAMTWLGHALNWASATHDLATRASVFTDLCTLVRLDNDHASAVTYGYALGAVDPRRGWIATLSHVYLARGFGMNGDLDECQRQIAAARRRLARLDGRDVAEAPWLVGDAGRLRVESGVAGALRDLSAANGDLATARRAVHATRLSLALLPVKMRPSRMLLTLRLADSHACAGEPDAAAAVLASVVDELETFRSSTIWLELGGLQRRLERWSDVPEVREIQARLAATH